MKNGTFLAGMTAALTLMTPPLLAADKATPPAKTGTLGPGTPAGIHTAQQVGTGLALVGTGAIIAVVAVAASGGNGNSVQSTTGTP